jgi:hypothetical protein
MTLAGELKMALGRKHLLVVVNFYDLNFGIFMLKIFENPAILNKRDDLKVQFKALKNDLSFLGNVIDIFAGVETWKFSTGPIFDQPPYRSEMSGFDPGRILKKTYPSPYDARLKGAYSSGFFNERHIVTVHPSKPENMPLTISRFEWSGDVLLVNHVKYYDHPGFKSSKPPSLIGMSIFYELSQNIRVDVGVGANDAFSITLYHYNERKMIQSASSVTAPFDFQSEYEMHYDGNDLLNLITSGDMTVWQRKAC